MDLAPVPQEPTAGPEWDAFVERGGGRFAHAYHLTAWREVHRRAYGREPIYLGARGATGELLGGLPLVVHGGALRGLARNLWRNLAKARDRGVVVRSVGSRMDLWRFYRQYVVAMRRHRAVPRSWLEVRWAHRLLAPSRRCGAWLGEYAARSSPE
ncbi:MAG TPA: hypothetical protein VFI54_11765 [Solirubrobacteraceae bacterium]|nr:hypothetical protein [Solirubrobacteraceae bacterium]